MGATEFIRRRLVEMRDEGNGVILVTSDLKKYWAFRQPDCHV
ncbi:hypothetical protein [Enterocloster sp.]